MVQAVEHSGTMIFYQLWRALAAAAKVLWNGKVLVVVCSLERCLQNIATESDIIHSYSEIGDQ